MNGTPGFWLIVALLAVTIVAPSLIWLADRVADAYDALTARRARQLEEDAATSDPRFTMVYRCQYDGLDLDPWGCSWWTTHYDQIDGHENQVEPGHFVIGQLEPTPPKGPHSDRL